MAKEMFYFMTKEDLIQLSEMISSKLDLIYLKNKIYFEPKAEKIYEIKDFQDLGINKSGNHQSESYIVLDSEQEVKWRKVEQSNGGYHYLLDQENNPISIVFWPGGLYEGTYLIAGHIGTLSNSSSSKKIYDYFQKAIKKLCKENTGRFYYSENVKKLKKVRLITMNVNEPLLYDISII